MERFDTHRRKIFGEMLNSRLMADCRIRKFGAPVRLGRIFTGCTVNVIKLLGLSVKRLKLVIRNRPGRRYAVVMFQFAEIFFSHAEKRGSVEFCVSANVVISMRVKRFAVLVVPHFFRVVFALDIHEARIPVGRLALHKIAAFENKYVLA